MWSSLLEANLGRFVIVYIYIVDGEVRILFSSLTLPHFCACPKLAQISNCIYHVFFLFSMLRWEVVVHFVDIDGIFPDCLDYIYSETCLNRTLNKPKSCINRTLNKLKSYINRTLNKPKSCINRTLNKPKSYINRILNKVPIKKIFVNLTCINQTPVYSEHNSWSQGSSV